MPAEHCVFGLHRLDASGHPLGTALRACRRMPSAVCTFAGVPHESVLVRPGKGAPTQCKKVNQVQKSFYQYIEVLRSYGALSAVPSLHLLCILRS